MCFFFAPKCRQKSSSNCLYGTDSQPVTACRLKLISSDFQWTNFQNSKKYHILWTHRTHFSVREFFSGHSLSLLYSTDHKKCDKMFPCFLYQIMVKLESQWQFWNLLVLRIPKLPQIVEFDEELAELLKVKHTWYHFKI